MLAKEPIKDWSSLLSHPQQVLGYYHESPSLEALLMRTFKVDGEGLQLRCDLSAFADKPSPRWSNKAKIVELTFDLSFIDSLKYEGVLVLARGELQFYRGESNWIEFVFNSDAARFSGRCKHMSVSRVSGYDPDAF